jgi:predicted nucleotidyltransferase
MLKIIDNLKPFFEDCYRRINVREYAKIMKISPPTASKILNYYNTEKLLSKHVFKNYMLFYANKESNQFIDLSRIYWRMRLKEIVDFMEKKLVSPTIMLFGSLSKAEAKSDSDIDLAVFAHKKKLNLGIFEKKLKRNIQVFWFKSINDIKNKELSNNIINGFILKGRLHL